MTSPNQSEGNTTKKRRLNLELTMPAYEILQKLATDSGRNFADILRIGLALFGILFEATQKGQKICICIEEDGKDKVLKEIVFPW